METGAGFSDSIISVPINTGPLFHALTDEAIVLIGAR